MNHVLAACASPSIVARRNDRPHFAIKKFRRPAAWAIQKRYILAASSSGGGRDGDGGGAAAPLIFPGGTRRASVRIPGLGLRMRMNEVVFDSTEDTKRILDTAVAAGVNLVVLEDGKEESLQLYEAARIVMSILRGRADLLVAERVDIASAANANGVILSDQGLPSVVARRMLQNAMPEAVVLPLIARRVLTLQSAENATVTEGADLLILKVDDPSVAAGTLENICKRVKIPVFVEFVSEDTYPVFLELFKAGASGVVLNSLPKSADVSTYVSNIVSAIDSAIRQSNGLAEAIRKGDPVISSASLTSIQQQADDIIRDERALLSTAVDIIREAAPEMNEVSLLVETIKQLDDLFLLVVVGEFNSGKSSVVNALLGGEFLKQGILPTTNEITLLKYSDESFEKRAERHPDGHLMRYLSAQLLKQMNLVDTPGTNVILQRQQRLTEEFVPRADLVMFVIGVERPLTESEVCFLRYIRKWDKKIIFALNKIDLLGNETEVAEVTKFVKDNVRQLLNIEEAFVYAVSARKALQAKKNATINGSIDMKSLRRDPLWKASQYENLENYVFGFLGGSSEAGAERIRLKLETPLGIAVALLSACQKQLDEDAARVQEDLKMLDKMQQQRLEFEELLANNSDTQMQRVCGTIDGAAAKVMELVDKTLRVSNLNTASKYLLPRGSAASSGIVEREIGTAFSDARRILDEHRFWLISNSQKQLEICQETGRNRWPDIAISDATEMPEPSKISLEALEGFDLASASVLLEQELRDVVLSTFGGAGLAGASASFLTSILPTSLEDTIALAICSAGGLTSIFKLPSLREQVKKKIKQVANSLAQKIRDAMREEVNESCAGVRETMELLTKPYKIGVETESGRVSSLRVKLLVIDKRIQSLRQRVQNLGSLFPVS